jgi:hypothetical protein
MKCWMKNWKTPDGRNAMLNEEPKLTPISPIREILLSKFGSS